MLSSINVILLIFPSVQIENLALAGASLVFDSVFASELSAVSAALDNVHKS
jgi:hypothetical protein